MSHTEPATSTSPPHETNRPPAPPHTPSSPALSALSHLTFPVSYTVSGLSRRLSQDDAPTALARALSANYNGSMTDPSSGVFHAPEPAKRRLSPFQPPPSTPSTSDGYRDSTAGEARSSSKALAEEIRLSVPPRSQSVDRWRLTYSSEQNGTSLGSLYKSCDEYRGKRGGFVLVVRDGGGGIFGAYLTDPPHPHPHYYGTGECFLWRAFRLPASPDLSSSPPPPSADTTNSQRQTTIGQAKATSASTNNSSTSLNTLTNLGIPGSTNGAGSSRSGTSTPERIRFKAFPYSGENDFTMSCQQNFLSVGGGDGHYGLWLDDNLARGISSACPTFMNEALSDEGEKFDVLGVEMWYIGA